MTRVLDRWRNRHRHELRYERPSLTGWGIVRCLSCDYTDIY